MSAAAVPAAAPNRETLGREFVEFSIRAGVLKFGEFNDRP